MAVGEESSGPRVGRRQFLKTLLGGLTGMVAIVAGIGTPRNPVNADSRIPARGNASGSSNVSVHAARYFKGGDDLAG